MPEPEPATAAAEAAAPPVVAPAASETAKPADEPDAEDDEPAPLRLPLTLQTSLGQGSFVANEYARNASFGYSLTFVPTYVPHRDVSVSLMISLSQELTDGDGDTERQQLWLSDTRLSGRYNFGKIPEAEIGVSADLRLFLPSSEASQHATLVLGTGVGVALSRAFGPVSLGLSGSFRKNFHRYTSPVLNADFAQPSVLPRAGSLEFVEDGIVQAGTNNVSHSIAGELSVGYSPIEPLTFSIAYGQSVGFTYRSIPLDEYSGVYAEEGVGQRDLMTGTIGASYMLDERFSFGAGVSTAGPPKTGDNKSFRFPFYDFDTEADNLTTFYVDATFTESLGK